MAEVLFGRACRHRLPHPRLGLNSSTGRYRRPEKPVYIPLQRSGTKPASRLRVGKVRLGRFSGCECSFDR